MGFFLSRFLHGGGRSSGIVLSGSDVMSLMPVFGAFVSRCRAARRHLAAFLDVVRQDAAAGAVSEADAAKIEETALGLNDLYRVMEDMCRRFDKDGFTPDADAVLDVLLFLSSATDLYQMIFDFEHSLSDVGVSGDKDALAGMLLSLQQKLPN